jgi:hypothetical protein
MKTYKDYNDLYNRIREDLKDIDNHNIANIMQELIYTIKEGINESEAVKQINDILFNEDEESEGV